MRAKASKTHREKNAERLESGAAVIAKIAGDVDMESVDE